MIFSRQLEKTWKSRCVPAGNAVLPKPVVSFQQSPISNADSIRFWRLRDYKLFVILNLFQDLPLFLCPTMLSLPHFHSLERISDGGRSNISWNVWKSIPEVNKSLFSMSGAEMEGSWKLSKHPDFPTRILESMHLSEWSKKLRNSIQITLSGCSIWAISMNSEIPIMSLSLSHPSTISKLLRNEKRCL